MMMLQAADHGARAVVVSNHGGRQLDGAVPALDALPGVVDAVEGRVEVIVDGGVRRATDIIKAIALGARAVMIARPLAWGLAVHGEDGVCRVLDLLRRDLLRDLTSAAVRRRRKCSVRRSFLRRDSAMAEPAFLTILKRLLDKRQSTTLWSATRCDCLRAV